jgi:hypothetical protein
MWGGRRRRDPGLPHVTTYSHQEVAIQTGELIANFVISFIKSWSGVDREHTTGIRYWPIDRHKYSGTCRDASRVDPQITEIMPTTADLFPSVVAHPVWMRFVYFR